MTSATGGTRDGGEIEALVTDHYLESLLSGTSQPVFGGLAPLTDRLDPGVRLAASRLSRDLSRFHPSFRFEERLAFRLGDIADTMRVPGAVDDDRTLIPFEAGYFDPLAPVRAGQDDGDRFLASLFDGPFDERLGRVRPLLIGGALTSAALSLAGAAFVAWRRTRPPVTPMARAVRAVARGRPA